MQSNINDIKSGLNSWHPCDVLRCTNWIYRIDALHNDNMREIQFIWKVAALFEGYATQFIIWAYAIKLIISRTQVDRLSEGLQKVLGMILKTTDLFWLEGYSYFLDFLCIVCYPVTNSATG